MKSCKSRRQVKNRLQRLLCEIAALKSRSVIFVFLQIPIVEGTLWDCFWSPLASNFSRRQVNKAKICKKKDLLSFYKQKKFQSVNLTPGPETQKDFSNFEIQLFCMLVTRKLLFSRKHVQTFDTTILRLHDENNCERLSAH